MGKFNIFVTVDEKFGLSRKGVPPWVVNACSVPTNIIIDHQLDQEHLGEFDPNNIIYVTSDPNVRLGNIKHICGSLLDAIKLDLSVKQIFFDDLYEEIFDKFSYLINIIMYIFKDYECDKFFHIEKIDLSNAIKIGTNFNSLIDKHQQWKIPMNNVHPEQQYLNLLSKILTEGDTRPDRTGTGTKSILGPQMTFDLRKGFPLLTTKLSWFKGIKKELLFFLAGKNDSKLLEAQGVNIWKDNTSTEYLQKNNLPWREGDMGPLYGHQWRHAGADYVCCDKDYTGQGIDQIKNLIDSIKTNPFSRSHIVSAWDVANISRMVLLPCNCFVQFYVGYEDSNPKYLDCSLYKRSGDMFLGVPFNIASYALLTEIIARKFVHKMGDAHIYLNHIDQVTEQLKRTPYLFPSVSFSRTVTDIDDLQLTDIVLKYYYCHQKITAKMAV